LPPPTTLATLLKAARTGKTGTTEALDVIFAQPGELGEHPNFPDLNQTGSLDVLRAWARAELRKGGLRTYEISHIDDWPPAQKEQVREALVYAIGHDLPVQFFWKLYDGQDEETEIDPPAPFTDATGITITFRSPEGKVRMVGPDNLTVDVGP
jgi:hypothetical protein